MTDEGFVSRWSRRKRGEAASVRSAGERCDVGRIEAGPAAATSDGAPQGMAQQTLDQAHGELRCVAQHPARIQPPDPRLKRFSDQSGEVVLADEDMPAIETLTDRSNLSMFFSKGVSDAVRRRALRHVFSGATFNVRCELDEYAEDYSRPALLSEASAARLRTWIRARQDAATEEARAELANASGPGERQPVPDGFDSPQTASPQTVSTQSVSAQSVATKSVSAPGAPDASDPTVSDSQAAHRAPDPQIAPLPPAPPTPTTRDTTDAFRPRPNV